DPKLGPLADNGGPTLTHPLLVGSPAFEAGSFDCPPPETDQRGVSRPQFVRCDIGATESEDILGIVSVTVDETATLLGTGRVTTTGTVYCGPVGDTVRVFVQVNQDSTGASSRVGSITDTCTGEPDEPWTVTPRKKSGSPAFSTGPAEVCFEVRTKEGSTLIDRAAGCEPVTLFSA
ncbi:MAG TPA: DUF6299 family protein, partial [Actinomycetota bacterium]|nr:DUF6299 family protein [Actinomycetota bacterium]